MIAALFAVALLAPPAPGAVAVPAQAATARPRLAIGVGMREWSLTVYRKRVRPGPVRFVLTNYGEDAHNLQIVRPGGRRSRVSADVAPGQGHGELRLTLPRPGTYTLLCVKPGHVRRGMRATLRVRG